MTHGSKGSITTNVKSCRQLLDEAIRVTLSPLSNGARASEHIAEVQFCQIRHIACEHIENSSCLSLSTKMFAKYQVFCILKRKNDASHHDVFAALRSSTSTIEALSIAR